MKALCFDLRKGAHSIGANVRDAAAYVVWALARSKDPSELRPYADNLARQLVTIALFDREIHIRRAASAAFQEHVGRTVSKFIISFGDLTAHSGWNVESFPSWHRRVTED